MAGTALRGGRSGREGLGEAGFAVRGDDGGSRPEGLREGGNRPEGRRWREPLRGWSGASGREGPGEGGNRPEGKRWWKNPARGRTAGAVSASFKLDIRERSLPHSVSGHWNSSPRQTQA